ncbi:MAG: transcription-repair coupling factor [Deltaproteobacteria bacterium]|jgi:transcription-repair coupling factor (superfamily II helicase)|nr:transcription-repair coupling factor [Deltaproteobacteria bacterium]
MSVPAEPAVQFCTLHGLIDEIGPPGIKHAEVLGISGCGNAWIASELIAKDPATRLVIIAADQAQAQKVHEALAFFHGFQNEILYFPHWETEPYAAISPHPEVEAIRLATLSALMHRPWRALVTTARAAIQKVIPREVVETLQFSIRLGQEYPRGELLKRLMTLGYRRVPLVEDRGCFAVRGELIDVFPPTSELPLRLTFFGDDLEEIRQFDATNQRSKPTNFKELLLLPAREMVLAGEHLETLSRQIKQRCDDLEIPRLHRDALLEEVREGFLGPGRENLLPLNYSRLESLFDYLGTVRFIRLDPAALAAAIDGFWESIQLGEQRAAERRDLYPSASQFYLAGDDFETQLQKSRRLDFSAFQLVQLHADHPVYRVGIKSNAEMRGSRDHHDGRLSSLTERLELWLDEGWRVLIACHQHSQAERLLDLLSPYNLPIHWSPEMVPGRAFPVGITVTVSALSSGFRVDEDRLAIITDDEIFGPRTHRRPRSARRVFETSLADLKSGDWVVHADYGIGCFHGLLHFQTDSVEGDYLDLEYAGNDRLYLPVDRIEKIQKYQSDGPAPKLDKMGSGAWEKTKLKARAAIEELARDLLQMQARRAMASGFQYSPPDRMFREFEAAFPYEETPDQESAIDAVLADMCSERPVDRLICGDVGYGKTEVAIRAAFKAVLDGRQVAVLVPTTVLARQHLETFRQRFQEYPVHVEMLSRFRTPAQQRKILQRVAQAQVDILIGTHRLLQRDVRFKDLGLVIVDEEQRFGVAHKERLKKMRAEVDIITLTATPIPRTLHMSLSGLRELSIIDTPPIDRQAVRTYVTRFDDDLIREAILRELRRGGQVYFVHNRVQSISAMAEFLKTLVPQAKIGVGHGQMPEKELERVMLDFIEGRTNLLICSTIIENGLDIPAANTIIVNRADCFGLAQLYQLRGRVGRSHQRAYAYLLIPGETVLSHDARERLKVLQEQTELGAGFRIARHDLELRGAGDLLGARQAGQVAAIGFEMYSELLEETIYELRGQIKEHHIDPEIRLGLSAFLPEAYVVDPNQRLVLYRKLAAARTEDELYEVSDELRDRYGELPSPAKLLLDVMKLRVCMKALRIEALEFDGHNLVFSFPADTKVSPEHILSLLNNAKKYRFSPDYRLSVRVGRLAANELLTAAKKELQAFCGL